MSTLLMFSNNIPDSFSNDNVLVLFQNADRAAMETKQWRYECQKCGRRFNRRVSLTRHNITVHQRAIWACTLCSAKLNSKYYLIRHEKRFHKSVMLDEGSSADKLPQLADNTVRQQAAPAGINNNGSGVSDLIQETKQVKDDLVFQGWKVRYRP